MIDVIVEFLSLFIVGGSGFIIGVVFMAVPLYLRGREMRRMGQDIDNLYKELSIATGSHSEDEHPDVERSSPISPVGDVPGAGSSPLGDASVGRKG